MSTAEGLFAALIQPYSRQMKRQADSRLPTGTGSVCVILILNKKG